jgi:ADP-ribosyl-[dinitrogen reductase] hydrolase
MWTGAMTGFAFTAPVLFSHFGPDRQRAGDTAGAIIARINTVGLWLGAIALLALLPRLRTRLARWRALLVAGAMAAALTTALLILPEIARAQPSQPIQTYAENDPVRVSYNKWHKRGAGFWTGDRPGGGGYSARAAGQGGPLSMQWDRPFLETLNRSRPDYDEPPRWQAALDLYAPLGGEEAALLDRAVIAMIDEDYRNPAGNGAGDRPFDDVMVNLPAGMTPDDLLCIEAAVLVAAERGLGEAFFAFNRLLRSPRWHAMYPRLLWLAREAFSVQRKLAATQGGRFLGAMLGLAAGDALGATLEFKSRAEIRAAYPDGFREITGGGPFGWKPGAWTDDTAMALAVARGIAESPDEPVEAVGRHLMAGYDSHPEGNGALVRTLPTALAYGSDVTRALAIGRMTHPHPESDAAVAVYHSTVAAALAAMPGALPARAAVVAAGLEAAGPLAERLSRLGALTEADVRATGYVVDTLEAALWCFLTTDSLEECVVRAVNLGEDTDTAGAVAGGLAGAYYGPGAVPRRWSTAIRDRDQLEEAAEQLFAVARAGVRL